MATPDPAPLEIQDLSLGFAVGGRVAPVLRDVSLRLHPEEVVGLVGESGSGKSTILYAVMNHLAPNARIDSGRVRYRGTDLLAADRPTLDRIRGRRIAMVFQDPGTALNPSMRVGRQIVEVLRRHLHMGQAQARERTLDLLRQVRLDDPARVFGAYPHELSGGMKQRAMIAMALSGEPDVLLMDEPTTGLDVIVQGHILRLIALLRHEVRAAILFVSHDLGAVAQIADRIGVLYAGDLMEIGPARDVLTRPRNPYTRGLLAAVPRASGRAALRAIPGSASNDPTRFERCVFADRCADVDALCRTSRPALVPISGGPHASRCHFAAELAGRAHTRGGAPELADTPAGDGPGGPLLRVRDLCVEYRRRGGLLGMRPRATTRALDGVSLTLGREQVVAVVGESGSGKSTLARTILRLEDRRSGVIEFEGRDVFAFGAQDLMRFRRSVQIVFQNPTSSLNPSRTVHEIVARPLRLQGLPARDVRERVRGALAAVNLGEGFLERYPHALSGGEKQRVALARAFVTEPVLVILDEPTTALDVSVQATILELLQALRSRARCAYLLISHDLAVVRHLAHEVIVMRGGAVCEAGPVARLFERPSHGYTRELLAAVPKLPKDGAPARAPGSEDRAF
jgi:peptide/nickel transport system ATP-binding protein